MSEQINKVLADRPQSFTTAEQAQARANIGAAAASAVGLTGVYRDSNLTGSGTSAEPLGLSSTIRLENSLSATKVGPAYVSAANHVGTAYMGPNEVYVNNKVYHESAQLLGGRLTFWDTATSEKVDMSSIQRWNSYSSLSFPQPQYSCHVFNISDSYNVTDWLYPSSYPSGLSADMRLDFIVYGSGDGYVTINTDLKGNTAELHTGESAAMFYNASADEWTTFFGNLP